jgi:hypothetical protein
MTYVIYKPVKVFVAAIILMAGSYTLFYCAIYRVAHPIYFFVVLGVAGMSATGIVACVAALRILQGAKAFFSRG